jgi:hypothetical protein
MRYGAYFFSSSFLAPARKEAKKQAQAFPLRIPFWRLLDKEKSECAHSPRIRTNVSKVKNR